MLEVLSTAIREEKQIKGIQIREVKLSSVADDTILYIENPKEATRKLLQLINEFGRVARYKINAQKSLAFLGTNDEKSEKGIGLVSYILGLWNGIGANLKPLFYASPHLTFPVQQP